MHTVHTILMQGSHKTCVVHTDIIIDMIVGKVLVQLLYCTVNGKLIVSNSLCGWQEYSDIGKLGADTCVQKLLIILCVAPLIVVAAQLMAVLLWQLSEYYYKP